MRKLLSIGALAAASLMMSLQPAMAGQRPVIVVQPHHNQIRHWHRWERWHRWHGHWRYQPESRQDGRYVRGYWYR